MPNPIRVTILSALFLLFFIPNLVTAQDKIQYKEYSYSEFFQMIEDEKDTIFRLSNSLIQFKPDQDSSRFGNTFKPNEGFESGRIILIPLRTDTITIDKELVLDNVQFLGNDYSGTSLFKGLGGINYMKFTKPITFTNTLIGAFTHISFEDRVRVFFSADFRLEELKAKDLDNIQRNMGFYFYKSNFKNGLRLRQYDGNDGTYISIEIDSCTFSPTNLTTQDVAIDIIKTRNFSFTNNTVTTSAFTNIAVSDVEYFNVDKNHFKGLIRLNTPMSAKRMSLAQNRFDKSILLKLITLHPTYTISWPQIENKLINGNFFYQKMGEMQIDPLVHYKPRVNTLNDENVAYYLDSLKIQDEFINKEESKIRGQLYDFYKSQHDIPYANRVYLELKDLETARLAYLYEQNPNFDTFFKWKVNQFLKTFSDYGTRPAKAITYSVYVVLLFALVYLFFPNHWDSHGKNRIMDRYRFFLKYVNKDSGLHEVYLDEKKPELLASEDFKTYLEEQGKTAPKFFMATALPLYRWSIAGTKTFSWLLSKVDILKGKWSETAPSK